MPWVRWSSRPCERGWSHGRRTDTWGADDASVEPGSEGAGGAVGASAPQGVGHLARHDPAGASQIGCGVESLRTWVKQADIDEGAQPGVTTAEAKRIKELEQEVRELRRANSILKSASAFFATELDRPQK